MQKRRTGLRVENDNRSQKSHYTNVSQIGSIPSKNLELSLEVELDEEVRNIIRNPEKCPSALLDVTVIKPKGLDQYTTNTQTLKTDQIKKLIGSMKLDSKDKRLLMDKLFGVTPKQKKNPKSNSLPTENKRKSCLSSKSKHIFRHSSINLGNQGDVRCITDESNTAVYSMYNQVSFQVVPFRLLTNLSRYRILNHNQYQQKYNIFTLLQERTRIYGQCSLAKTRKGWNTK